MYTAAVFRSLPLLLLLDIGSCALPEPPPASARALNGLVRANDPQAAADLATTLDDVYPMVMAGVPGTRERKLEVWIQGAEAPGDRQPDLRRGAYCSSQEGLIVLRPLSALSPQADLAHELVHCLLDDSWRALPDALEEGLCHLVAESLFPEHAPFQQALSYAGMHLGLYGRLRLSANAQFLDSTNFHHAPSRGTELRDAPYDHRALLEFVQTDDRDPDFEPALRGLGYFLVHAIVKRQGLAGLRRLSEEALASGNDVVPASSSLTAAGLPDDILEWRPQITALLDEEAARQLVLLYQEIAVELAAELPIWEHPEVVAFDDEQLLERVVVWFRIDESSPSVRLDAAPALRAAVLTELRERRAHAPR